jgi:ubiquinone/menaquinone biosynthesis C-methylase UbiE
MKESIENDAKDKYNDGVTYKAVDISTSLFSTGTGYAALLLEEKAALLQPLVRDKNVLDIGCGNGRHLADLSSVIRTGVGVDFSAPFVKYASEAFSGSGNLRFLEGDARKLPVSDGAFDCAYSFATLYNIDDTGPVYRELARVLAPSGFAVLELGNSTSFATLVSKQYGHISRHSQRTIGEHLSGLRRNGLRIVTWRSFQLLPMWGDKPDWLQILRRPGLERLIMRKVAGRMIDERIGSIPVIRRFAFRHLVVAQKPQ